jgi:CRP-like cAMP-binding protein
MTPEKSNLLLQALPSPERESLLARMETVSLPIRTVFYEQGEQPEYAHFMTSGIASIVAQASEGNGTEVGLIGREGLVEAVNLLGPAAPPTTAFIQVAGSAQRLRFSELQKYLFTSNALLHRVLESVQCNSFILAQLTACNGLHEIEERLARWLLMVSDRVQSDKFFLTQEFLAEMLGTRRTSVTLAAGNLHRAGLIEYTRGHIHILDRERLQGAACECYPVMRDLAAKLYQGPINGGEDLALLSASDGKAGSGRGVRMLPRSSESRPEAPAEPDPMS